MVLCRGLRINSQDCKEIEKVIQFTCNPDADFEGLQRILTEFSSNPFLKLFGFNLQDTSNSFNLYEC